jgi:hypothetical protein
LIEWAGIHFLYVQFGNHLHILQFAPSCEDDRRKANVVMGEPDADDTAMMETGAELFLTIKNADAFLGYGVLIPLAASCRQRHSRFALSWPSHQGLL